MRQLLANYALNQTFLSSPIGGGDGNGILLHEGLTQGKTERCATFNNPPLCQSGDFSVAAIEVYGLVKLDY